MASISSLGIGSGVLTSDLVDQLVSAEKKPATQRLTSEADSVKAKLSAYGQLRSAVTELRLPMRQLSAADNLTAFSATSSSEDVVVSLDDSKASRGNYSIQVDSLAQAQSLASGSFADKDATAVGTGSLTLTVGDESKTLTIDSSNNTLQGLANEINDAGLGVTAGIIDTGDGYKLVMSAEETGTANAISVSVSDSDGGDADASGLSQFVFNETNQQMTETVEAKNAVVQINGIEITRSTNNIENVIDGLSFEVKAEGATSNVKVSQDFESVAGRVQSFVDKFNSLQSAIDSLTAYSTESEQGSVLTGDSTIRGIQNQLRSVLTNVVPGLENSSVRSLADVGIGTDFSTGQLEFDKDKFIEQLKEHPDDVTALFAEQGRATDSQVEFVRSGLDTVPGEYDINVTQAATQGSLNYAAGDVGTVSVAEGNQFTFKVDGETTVNVSLAAGDYTGAEFAEAIQGQLNGNTALQSAGGSVEVAFDATDGLTFTSEKFGSESNVSLTGLQNVTGLGSKDGTVGQDVAGTIDGRTAKGDGQVLYLGSDNGPASGIQVRISGENTGSRGSISFIEGVAEQTVDLVSSVVGADGSIESRTDSLTKELESLAEEQSRLEERMTSYRERLVSQFTAADSLISQLNNTKDYVTQQLAALAPNNSKS